jgi:hypothetical protein
MKFMITYSYPANNFPPVLKAWGSMSPQEQASVGDGGKKLGHWHDVVGRRAFVFVESSDLAAVARWAGGWNSLGDATITPVLDDEESGAVARQVAVDHNA